MINRASELDEYFGTTKAADSGYEIWNMERLEALQVRFRELEK
jgi:hypothetical protein